MCRDKLRKFLVISPAWLGDLIMAQGLLKTLKRQYPDSLIGLVAPVWSKSLVSRMPEVDHCLYVDFKRGQLQLNQRIQIGKQLAQKQYDQAFVLPNSFKSAIIPLAADIPIRTGWRGEMRYFLLNDIRLLNKKYYPLMLQRYVALAYPSAAQLPDRLMYPGLISSPEQAMVMAEQFKLIKHGQNLADNEILVIAPGAAYGPSKRWPASYFADVINHQVKNRQQEVWLLGNGQDPAITTAIVAQLEISARSHCYDLAGKTSLDNLVDLISLADYVITNDSGLMHLTAALGRKQLALFGSTSPEHTPPLNEHAETLWLGLDCSPCFKRTCPLKHFNCMQQLKPEIVIRELNKL